MQFSEASIKYQATTDVAVGCLDCPTRQILEYGQEPDVPPPNALRAGLLAAAHCAILNAGLPEGDRLPYAVHQTVRAVVRVDGQQILNSTGCVTSIESPPEGLSECPPDCAERVVEFANSVRGAVEEGEQTLSARGF